MLLIPALVLAVPLADPTAPSPPLYGASDPGRLAQGLTFTRVTKNRREAVINGVKVTEGDWLGDMHIQHIRHGEVVVERNHRQTTLHLLPKGIKRKQTP